MKHLVVYDIRNDRIRGKIADVCLDFGLDRIQWSAFVGDLTRTHQEELWQNRYLSEEPVRQVVDVLDQAIQAAKERE